MSRDFEFWFDIAKIIFFIGLVVIFVILFFPFVFEYWLCVLYDL